VTTDAVGPSPSLARAASLLGPAMALANALQYALQLTASRALSSEDFGAFGSLLGLGVVGAVPMLALQTVAARQVALRGDDPAARRNEVARLQSTSRRAGLGISVLGLLSAPAVAAFLHVPVLAAMWLALSLGPLAVAGTCQGVLQGRQRFAALSAVFLGVSVFRVLGGVAGLLLVPHVTWGLAGTAFGAAAGALMATVATRHETSRQRGAAPPGFLLELRRASSGVLALLLLGGADLLLARHVLPGRESGRYAVGSLFARGCFWLPQFVAVLVVPRLSTGEEALARRALAFVAGLGVLEALAALVVPPYVVALLFGARYGSMAHLLVLFALEGACLAVLQLLLYGAIARAGAPVGWVLWTAIAVEAGTVLTVRPGLVGVVGIALACNVAAVLTVLWTVERRGRPRLITPHQGTATGRRAARA
jgi:O-antigen/teichoic acid export membrane protein